MVKDVGMFVEEVGEGLERGRGLLSGGDGSQDGFLGLLEEGVGLDANDGVQRQLSHPLHRHPADVRVVEQRVPSLLQQNRRPHDCNE